MGHDAWLAWLDGEEIASFEEHVASCARCRMTAAMLAEAERETGASQRPGAFVSPPETFPPGASLGRYIIDAWAGAGAMGTVYRARDPQLGRKVAIKVLRPREGGPDPLREARAMARLAHPHVVAVHDVGTSDGHDFVAMEFVSGKTLRAWLAEMPRSPEAILDAFIQAGRGLEAAHAAGIVHRDFKPDNVLVGDDGRVRVTDFGVARLHELPEERVDKVDAEGAIRSVAVIGTPAYAAPEVKRGTRADARADQYSYCVSLHEALVGVRPDAMAPAPRHAPRRVLDLLARGLSAEAQHRYPSMGVLLEELGAARERLRRGRSTWRPYVVGACALALLAGIGAAWSRPAPSTAREVVRVPAPVGAARFTLSPRLYVHHANMPPLGLRAGTQSPTAKAPAAWDPFEDYR